MYEIDFSVVVRVGGKLRTPISDFANAGQVNHEKHGEIQAPEIEALKHIVPD